MCNVYTIPIVYKYMQSMAVLNLWNLDPVTYAHYRSGAINRSSLLPLLSDKVVVDDVRNKNKRKCPIGLCAVLGLSVWKQIYVYFIVSVAVTNLKWLLIIPFLHRCRHRPTRNNLFRLWHGFGFISIGVSCKLRIEFDAKFIMRNNTCTARAARKNRHSRQLFPISTI